MENILWIIGGLVAVCLLMLVVAALCYRKPAQGQALIRTGMGGPFVSFSGKIVLPLLHKAEFLDVTLKRLVIERQGQQALTCKDGIRADVTAAFFIRINPAVEDVLKVVSKSGVSQAADAVVLKEIYAKRFNHALTTVASEHDYETLTDREVFKQKVMDSIGKDLDGFVLDVVAIDYLEKSKQ